MFFFSFCTIKRPTALQVGIKSDLNAGLLVSACIPSAKNQMKVDSSSYPPHNKPLSKATTNTLPSGE